jgi:hypothetical protein
MTPLDPWNSREEHPGRHGQRGVPDREAPAVGPDGGVELGPGEPELIGGQVEPDRAVTRVGQDRRGATGPAGHVDAYLPAARAEELSQERGFFLVE